MEKDLLRLEEMLDKKYEDWTQETLGEILGNEEAIKLFTPELVVHILINRKNDNIVDTLVPVKYGFDIRAIKQKIEEQLVAHKENGLSLEDYRKEVLKYKEMDNPIFKLAVYLTEIASFGEDYDVSKEEADIKATIVDYKKVLSSLNFDHGFQVIIELFDLLFPFRELYFQRYKVDLIKDDKDIKDLLDKVNERTKEMMDYFAKEEKAKHDHEHHHDEEQK
jgi:hypothetical protein